MKKVLINGRYTSHHFAIRNVIYNITKELSEKDNFAISVLLNRDSDFDCFEKLNVEIVINPCPSDSALLNHLYTIFVLPMLLFLKRIDVVIYPQICIYLFNPCKTVLYMHDLIEYYLDNQDKRKILFRKIAYPYVCKHADDIVAVSQNTKNDVAKFLSICKEKITVAYNGYSNELYPVDKKLAKQYVYEKYGIKNFLYYIGYLSHPQKNLIYLIDEFVKLKKKYPDLELVFAGPRGKDAELILQRINEVELSDSFHYLGKVPFEDLSYLYSSCEIFCFPSIYEGFGMPVLEAMVCGAVVVTSNVSSMPEIQTNPRCLIEPNKENDLFEKIDKLLISEDLQELSEKNIELSAKFSWRKHGYILSNVINK